MKTLKKIEDGLVTSVMVKGILMMITMVIIRWSGYGWEVVDLSAIPYGVLVVLDLYMLYRIDKERRNRGR